MKVCSFLLRYICGDGVKAGWGQGQEVYNERIYTVVWLNNLQPAEMELVSQCNFMIINNMHAA